MSSISVPLATTIISKYPYHDVPLVECGDDLVDLSSFPFVLAPMYHVAGHTAEPRMFLRSRTAELLVLAQEKIAPFRFKIWDGYRPRTVQAKLWETFSEVARREHPEWSDEELFAHVRRYLAYPYEASQVPPHSTGGTVDLTLVDANGQELDMGTEFDYFGELAHALHFEWHPENEHVRDNRRLLRGAMAAAGFRMHPHEWWHFDYGNQPWAWSVGATHAFFGECLAPA